MASLLGVEGLVKKDFMAKNGLKPWWEELRSYANAITVGAALFTTWITTEIDQVTACLPEVDNHTTDDYSEEEANLVNTYCDYQLSWYVVYPGLAALSAVLIVYFAANSWSIIPSVVKSVKTFKKAEDDYKEARSDPSRKRKIKERLDAMDENAGNSCCSIKGIYFTRNLLVLLVTATICGLGAFEFTLLLRDGNYLECQFPQDEKLTGALAGRALFICSYKNAQRLLPSAAFLTLSSFLEFMSIALGTLFLVKKFCCTSSRSKHKKCSYFLITLWDHSNPNGCENFARFVKGKREVGCQQASESRVDEEERQQENIV